MWRMLSSSAAASVPAAVDLHRPHRLLRGCLRWLGTLHAPKLWQRLSETAFLSIYEPTIGLFIQLCHRIRAAPSCSGLWGANSFYCSLETRGRLLLKTSRRYFRTIRHNTRLFCHWRFGPSFSSAAFSALQYVMGSRLNRAQDVTNRWTDKKDRILFAQHCAVKKRKP